MQKQAHMQSVVLDRQSGSIVDRTWKRTAADPKVAPKKKRKEKLIPKDNGGTPLPQCN
jgi:hypothetical protein